MVRLFNHCYSVAGEKKELFSLYFVMFNRRAAAFKPPLFSKVCFLFFCTPCLPTSTDGWNLNAQFLFECVL